MSLLFSPVLLAQPVGNLNELVPAARTSGQARLRFWGLDVYDASLWIAPDFRKRDFISHGFALQLQYLRGFSGADIAQRSIDEMRRAGGPGFSAQQASAWRSELAKVMPDVRAGDRVTGVNRPGRPALFMLNDTPLGEVGDRQFARLFFGIWLAPHTSEPALRDALLAGARE